VILFSAVEKSLKIVGTIFSRLRHHLFQQNCKWWCKGFWAM